MFDFLARQFAQNQFLSGGLVLMLGGALVALLRRVPGDLYALLRRQLVTTITIYHSDSLHGYLMQWLSQNAMARRSRSLVAGLRFQEEGQNFDLETQCMRPTVFFTPAPGRHLLRVHGMWLMLERTREKLKETPYGGLMEELHLTFFSRQRRRIQQFFEEIVDLRHPPGDRRITLMVPNDTEWNTLDARPSRALDSVVCSPGVVEDITADLRRFVADREWYRRTGVPYRRGYLLHGPPGNGKSSLILALATEMQMPLCLVNLSNPFLTDNKLTALLASVPERAIVVFEDIDAMKARGAVQRTTGRGGEFSEERQYLSLSGLLNALDGLGSREGQIVMMTTNRPDDLDAALVRPGRCDRHYHLDNATAEQAERLFLRFFADQFELARAFSSVIPDYRYSMASLQGHLLRYRDDPRAAVRQPILGEQTDLGDTLETPDSGVMESRETEDLEEIGAQFLLGQQTSELTADPRLAITRGANGTNHGVHP